MVNGFTAFGFADLCLAFTALELFTFLDLQYGAGTTTCGEAPLLDSAAEVLAPFSAVVVLFVAVVFIYNRLMGRRVVAVPVPVPGVGDGRRSTSRHLVFVLCVSAGTLEFIVFGGKAGGGGAQDHGAQARALGLAALRALPAAATATFFLGMMLIIVAHVRAGAVDGGTVAVAGDRPIHGLLRLLSKTAAGAAATLVGLMAMAVTFYRAAKC